MYKTHFIFYNNVYNNIKTCRTDFHLEMTNFKILGCKKKKLTSKNYMEH